MTPPPILQSIPRPPENTHLRREAFCMWLVSRVDCNCSSSSGKDSSKLLVRRTRVQRDNCALTQHKRKHEYVRCSLLIRSCILADNECRECYVPSTIDNDAAGSVSHRELTRLGRWTKDGLESISMLAFVMKEQLSLAIRTTRPR